METESFERHIRYDDCRRGNARLCRKWEEKRPWGRNCRGMHAECFNGLYWWAKIINSVDFVLNYVIF